MYHPYFRAKQFELILLRENAELIAANNIHPIIEPIKENLTTLSRALSALDQKQATCTVVINPKVGDNVAPSHIISEIKEIGIRNQGILLGCILDAHTALEELLVYLETYKEFNFSIIHWGFLNSKKLAESINGHSNVKKHIFIDKFSGKLYRNNFKESDTCKVLLHDGFKKRNNADYPSNEHFSDLHITYDLEDMQGFGDYLVVGDNYFESGGPAYAIAIHLTYIDKNEDNNMFIYHFVSYRTEAPIEHANKFLQALTKLLNATQQPASMIFNSNAIKKFQELHDNHHYPGLGYIKKLSMQHHLEIIAEYCRRKQHP